MNCTAFPRKPLAVLALIAATLPAVAGEGTASATLSIEGIIKPKPCNAQFENGGKIDFGSLDIGTLKNEPTHIKVGERAVKFQVFCAHDATVHFHVIDNRPGTADQTLTAATADFHYGLGMDENNKSVGTYHIQVMPTGHGDNQPVSLAANDVDRTNDSSWKQPANDYYAAPNRWLSWSAKADLTPSAFRRFSADLLVHVYIPTLDKLDLGKEIRLDGLSTFEIKYT